MHLSVSISFNFAVACDPKESWPKGISIKKYLVVVPEEIYKLLCSFQASLFRKELHRNISPQQRSQNLRKKKSQAHKIHNHHNILPLINTMPSSETNPRCSFIPVQMMLQNSSNQGSVVSGFSSFSLATPHPNRMITFPYFSSCSNQQRHTQRNTLDILDEALAIVNGDYDAPLGSFGDFNHTSDAVLPDSSCQRRQWKAEKFGLPCFFITMVGVARMLLPKRSTMAGIL